MAQRSTRSERRAKVTPTPTSSHTARRVDAARHKSSRWISPLRQQSADSPAVPQQRSVSGVRLDRLVRQDPVQRNAVQEMESARIERTETAFERSIRDMLSVPRWRSQLTDLAQSLSDLSQKAPATVAIVSLSDELDVARAVMALALLQDEAHRRVLVVDADRHRRTLSILLQHNNSAGLWDAIPAGLPAQSLAIPLASEGISFLPAGSRTIAVNSAAAEPSLQGASDSFALTLLAAGVWPTPDLRSYAEATARVYAVVRCGSTHRKSYRELVDVLRQSGKRISGCIVSGSYE